MSDQPLRPEDAEEPLDAHEMPTRRVEPVDEEALGLTQPSSMAPPDLPDEDTSFLAQTQRADAVYEPEVPEGDYSITDALQLDGAADDFEDAGETELSEAAHEFLKVSRQKRTGQTPPEPMPKISYPEPEYDNDPYQPLDYEAPQDADDSYIPEVPQPDELPSVPDAFGSGLDLSEPQEDDYSSEPLFEMRRQPTPPSVQPVDASHMAEQPPILGGFDDRSDPRRGRRRTARERRDSGLYLPWWSLVILLAVVTFFAVLLFMGLNFLGGQFVPGGETPVVIVITSTPTLSPTDAPTLIPTPTSAFPTATPRPVLYDGAPVAEVAAVPEQEVVGLTVRVAEVGAAGLNIRDGAGTGFDILFLAAEGDQFQVLAGPVAADGFVWWQVRDVANPTREGWAVENFLTVVMP